MKDINAILKTLSDEELATLCLEASRFLDGGRSTLGKRMMIIYRQVFEDGDSPPIVMMNIARDTERETIKRFCNASLNNNKMVDPRTKDDFESRGLKAD